MTNAESIAAILDLIHERETFVVTSHARPDGDAIGSALGTMFLLEAMGKQVHITFADPVPTIYRTLPGAERIVNYLPNTTPDAVLVLECDSLERTGFRTPAWEALGRAFVINIDHHHSGKPFGDFNWIDPTASAVGAMMYDLVVESGVEITPPMATCLYAAVLTDTGSFTYPTTVAATFGLAEHLLQRGADSHGVSQAVYFSNSPGKIRALGAALFKMEIRDSVAWSWITQDEMERAGATVEDCEGVVNYLISISGVRAAAFLRELAGGGRFRMSVRSKGDVNVAHVAESFGGGGHQHASGCTVEGPLEEAIPRVLTGLQAACQAPGKSLVA